MAGFGGARLAALQARQRFGRGYSEAGGSVTPYKGQGGPGAAFSGAPRVGRRRRDEEDAIAGDSRQRAREAVRANLEAARADIPGVAEARAASRGGEESVARTGEEMARIEGDANARNASLEAGLLPRVFGEDWQRTFQPGNPEHQERLRQAKVAWVKGWDRAHLGSGADAGALHTGTGQQPAGVVGTEAVNVAAAPVKTEVPGGGVVPGLYPYQTTAGVPRGTTFPGMQQPVRTWPSLVPVAAASPTQVQQKALDVLAASFGEDYEKWTPGQKALFAQEEGKIRRAKGQEAESLRGPLGAALPHSAPPPKALPASEPQSRLDAGFRTPRDVGVVEGLAATAPMPAQFQPSMGPSAGLVADRAAAEQAAADAQAARVARLAAQRQAGAVANEEKFKIAQANQPAPAGPFVDTGVAPIPQVDPEYIARRRATLKGMWDKAQAEGNEAELERLRGEEWEFDEKGNRITSLRHPAADIWGDITGAASRAGEAIAGGLGMLEGKRSAPSVSPASASTTTTFIPGAGVAQTQAHGLPLTNEERVARYMAADPTVSRDEALVALGLRKAPVQPTFIPGAGVAVAARKGAEPTFIPGAGMAQAGGPGGVSAPIFVPGAGTTRAGVAAAKTPVPAPTVGAPARVPVPTRGKETPEEALRKAKEDVAKAEKTRQDLLTQPLTPETFKASEAANQALYEAKSRLKETQTVAKESAAVAKAKAAERAKELNRAKRLAEIFGGRLAKFEKENKADLEVLGKKPDPMNPVYVPGKRGKDARDLQKDQEAFRKYARLRQDAEKAQGRYEELALADEGEAMDPDVEALYQEKRRNPAFAGVPDDQVWATAQRIIEKRRTE